MRLNEYNRKIVRRQNSIHTNKKAEKISNKWYNYRAKSRHPGIIRRLNEHEIVLEAEYRLILNALRIDVDEEWITLENGTHVPVKEGQTKKEATETFVSRKEAEKSMAATELKGGKPGTQDYSAMPRNSINKSIRTHSKRVAEHKSKISAPEAVYKDWGSFNDRRKAGVLTHWQKEIDGFEREIEAAKQELLRRDKNA